MEFNNNKIIGYLKWFLLSLDGRISRKPFWIFSLSVTVIVLILQFLFGIKMFMEGSDSRSIVFFLIVLWPTLAVQSKRWHDRNKSTWWVLINFIPIIGSIWALVENGFLEGTRGANRFGDDTLGYDAIAKPKESIKPMGTSPLLEKDIAIEFKEAMKAVSAAVIVIALIIFGTWFYLSYMKR